MCGIVGIVNNETGLKSEELVKFFTQGLYVDALRGKHGTGVFSVSAKKEVDIYKKALCAADFLELGMTDKIITGSKTVLVGHNRHATQGSHTADNTHPFQHGHITLVHNGSVYKGVSKIKASFAVDSEAICHALSVRETVEVLEALDGAYSLVWYDSIKETINFARNEDRPMYIAEAGALDSLVFASEPGMISWLAERNGIVLKTQPASTDVGKWYSIPVFGLEKGTVTEFKPKEKITYTNYYTNRNYYYNKSKVVDNATGSKHERGDEIVVKIDGFKPYNLNEPEGKGQVDGHLPSNPEVKCKFYNVFPTVIKDLVGKNVKAEVVYVISKDLYTCDFIYQSSIKKKLIGPRGVEVEKKEWDELTKGGCAYCTSNILDSEGISWACGYPVCKECSSVTYYI